MPVRPALLSFEALRLLGTGAAGEVWEARHESGERVALKLLKPSVSRHALAREVDASGRLDHPNVAQLWDVGVTAEPEPRPWLALEHLSGGTLAEARGLLWPQIRDALDAVLSGLAHAHAHGVLHRDLKPSNVLRASPGGRWVIADFGIARLDGAKTRGISGTPGYMAPEQRSGDWRREGPHTDLYAVGVMAWRLCCGRLPTATHDVSGDRSFEPTLPVPAELYDWLLWLLAADPAYRVDVAADALAGLRALGDAVVARPDAGWVAPLSPESSSGETWLTETELAPEPAPLGAPARVVLFSPHRGERPARRVGPVPPGTLGSAKVGRRPAPAPTDGLDDAWGLLTRLTVGRTGPPSQIVVVAPPDAGGDSWIGAFCRDAAAVGAARIADLRPGRPDLAEQLPPSLLDSAPVGASPVVANPTSPARGADPMSTRLLLAHAATDRPVIVWTDPATAGALGAAELGAVLVVCTSPEERAADLVIHLKPKPEGVIQGTLNEMLPLESETLAWLIARSGGYPGRAAALLERLCRLGQLRSGPGGFARTNHDDTDDTLEVPVGIQILAMGGDHVAASDWNAVLAGCGLPEEDGSWLVERSLARFAADGVVFPSTAARHALLRSSPPRREAAAAWLERLGDRAGLVLTAELLLRAGREAEGVRAASRATHHRSGEVAFGWALAALLDQLGTTSEAAAMSAAIRADLMIDTDDRDGATRLTDEAERLAPDSSAVRGRVATLHAQLARARGADPLPWVDQALLEFERDGDTDGVEGCWLWKAELAVPTDHDRALGLLARLVDARDPMIRRAAARRTLMLRGARGIDVRGALSTCEVALSRALAEGQLLEAQQLLNTMGTLHRQLGDHVARRRAFEQGAALSVGQRRTRAIFALNASLAAFQLGDPEGARELLEVAARCATRDDLRNIAEVGLAVCRLLLDNDPTPLASVELPADGAALGMLLEAAPAADGALHARILEYLRGARGRYTNDPEVLARVDAVVSGAAVAQGRSPP